MNAEPGERGVVIPYAKILRCPANGQAYYTLLSARLEALPMHFDGRGSVPCLVETEEGCPYCPAGRRCFVEWYAWAQSWPGGKLVVAAISEGAVKHCPELLAVVEDCRGYRVRLFRWKNHRSGVAAQMQPGRVPDAELPRVLCPIGAYLARLWDRTQAPGQSGEIRVEQPADPPPIPLPADTPAAARPGSSSAGPISHRAREGAAPSSLVKEMLARAREIGRMPNGD